MTTEARSQAAPAQHPDLDVLREVVEALAPLEREAGSHAEAAAADWICARLQGAGAPAAVEEVEYRRGYPHAMAPVVTAGSIAGLVALSGRARRAAAAVAGLATAAIADDADNRWRVWRRLATRPRPTTNVVAELGDPEAERTLVVLAHHDAAPTGVVFDQSFQRWLARRFPDLIQNTHTSLPMWWPVLAGPAAIAVGAATGRRGVLAAGTALSLLSTALGANITFSRVVPGANDNLSAVAVLVGLAGRLAAEPPEGLRVVVASCGAEEVLQGGIYPFVERHLAHRDREATYVLNLDTVGSPHLVLLEGEGILAMEDYPGPEFRDLIAAAAEDAEIPLLRGQRSRASTDSVVPARAGFPTATIASIEPETKLLSNYHLPTDTPENLDYSTVAEALDLTHAVARRLAAA